MPLAFLYIGTSRTGCSLWHLAGIPGYLRTIVHAPVLTPAVAAASVVVGRSPTSALSARPVGAPDGAAATASPAAARGAAARAAPASASPPATASAAATSSIASAAASSATIAAAAEVHPLTLFNGCQGKLG